MAGSVPDVPKPEGADVGAVAEIQCQLTDPDTGGVPAGSAEVPSLGTNNNVLDPLGATLAVYVMVIIPVLLSTPTLLTLSVCVGAFQPEVNGDPFAAFSLIDVFALAANAKPSVTFALTI